MSEFFVSKLGPQPSATARNPLAWSALLNDLPENWSVPEAFVAILLGAVTCDGEVAAVEHEELLALAHRSRALKSLTTAELSDLNVKVMARLQNDPRALGDACAALPEEMRLCAFAHALDLVLADGELTIDEADFLNTLIIDLKLDRDGVAKVSDVMVLKNQY